MLIKEALMKKMEYEDVTMYNQFLTAPASTKFHGARVGGLYEHCESVTNNLLMWKEKHPNTELTKEDCYICGMLHDLCKVNLYKKIGDTYTYDKSIVVHHAKLSVEMIEKRMLLKLTTLQRCMILLHMSSWSNDEDFEALTDEDKEWLKDPRHIQLIQAMNWADMKATNEDK